MTRVVRCAVYTRKSTEEGLEQDFNSLDAQRESCEAYVTSQKAEGWIALKDRFDDGGFSGGTLQRPALQRILKNIEDGAVDVVVVYKIDRLSRSLMDFAKLVEVFDRRSVTFVSVTQSFNTTTSMGRLTLNVLLSFAQFEREVTGERIRDKIAASKKKGIWMGGNPPFGYNVANRKLVVNETEADTTRLIFERYLQLGCVRLLCADLTERGIISKRRLLKSGKQIGGTPLGHSALNAILNNPTYLGRTQHKGHSYRGEHAAIVPRELFDQVQQKLASQAPPISREARAAQDAMFTGMLFDDTGEPMRPTYAIKRGSIRYRYYVSRPALKGYPSKASIPRIPAPAFETFLMHALDRLGLKSGVHADSKPEALRRIDILANSIILFLDRDTALGLWRTQSPDLLSLSDRKLIEARQGALEAGEVVREDGARLELTLPVRAKFHGGAARMTNPSCDTTPATHDAALLKALARAHRWRQMLLTGEVTSIDEIARRFGLDRGHAGKTLNLAFLHPALQRAIASGAQPPTLTLTRLLDVQLPLSWTAQQAIIGRLSTMTTII
ncbi:MAG TPA: recombinase family protein [Rhizomicrobium sp.]|jgi:DNA invertase Pin-like site-specific DNA recombinase